MSMFTEAPAGATNRDASWVHELQPYKRSHKAALPPERDPGWATRQSHTFTTVVLDRVANLCMVQTCANVKQWQDICASMWKLYRESDHNQRLHSAGGIGRVPTPLLRVSPHAGVDSSPQGWQYSGAPSCGGKASVSPTGPAVSGMVRSIETVARCRSHMVVLRQSWSWQIDCLKLSLLPRETRPAMWCLPHPGRPNGSKKRPGSPCVHTYYYDTQVRGLPSGPYHQVPTIRPH